MTEELLLKIEECHDCPRLHVKAVRHFLMDANQVGYRYTCTKANRVIEPSDGVRPPPEWCPIREN